jgi:cytochrome P450
MPKPTLAGGDPEIRDGGLGFHLAATRHGEVRELLRHSSLSSDRSLSPVFSRHARLRGYDVDANMRSLLVMDPPEHTRIRKRVGDDFRERFGDGLARAIRSDASRLLECATDGRSPFDLVASFAQPLPARAIAVLMGLAPEDHERFCDWSIAMTSPLVQRSDAASLARADRAERELGAFLLQELALRRRESRDDLIADLVAEADGCDLEFGDAELLALLRLLLVAGHETTTRSISVGVALLLADGTAWEWLRSDRDRIPAAVEELLRLTTPIRAIARFVAEPFEFAGIALPRHGRVTLWLDAANRDPAVFANADSLELDREPNPHLTFGFGTHFCLGASLARLEIGIALEALLDHFPGASLAETEPRWSSSPLICELRHLRVRPR